MLTRKSLEDFISHLLHVSHDILLLDKELLGSVLVQWQIRRE